MLIHILRIYLCQCKSVQQKCSAGNVLKQFNDARFQKQKNFQVNSLFLQFQTSWFKYLIWKWKKWMKLYNKVLLSQTSATRLCKYLEIMQMLWFGITYLYAYNCEIQKYKVCHHQITVDTNDTLSQIRKL